MIGRKYFFTEEKYGRLTIGIPIEENIFKIDMLIIFFIYVYFEFTTPYTTLGNRGVFSPEILDHGLTNYDIMMNLFLCVNILQIVIQTNYFM